MAAARPMSTRTGFQPSYQAVILAAPKDNQLAPLTDGALKATLPVANKLLISYQLDYLEQAGVTDVIIVTSAAAAALLRGIADGRTTMRVSVEAADEDAMGTADALRGIAAKLYTDFIVMSCDLMTNVQLGTVLDTHRVHQGALTALVVQQPPADDKGKKVKTDDFVMLDETTDTLLMVAAKASLKETLDVRRALFDKYSRVAVRTDLADPHFYVFAHWVLSVLEKKSDFKSIKDDLVPFLLRKQYSMNTADRAVFPAEASAVANPRVQHLAMGMSSAERSEPMGPDGAELLHCHAFVVDATKNRCQRVNTLAAYSEVNRNLAKGYRPSPEARAALAALPARLIGSECVVGAGLTATGEGSSVKKSVVGANCTIGANVKIVNCVLMDNVTIEDGCSLSGVTVCSGAHIEQGCELREGTCVGHGYRLPGGTQAKEKHFSADAKPGGGGGGD